MFVNVSPSFGLETDCRVPQEGRVPDGVVSPSSGPDMQMLVVRCSASPGFGRLRQFNSFVQQFSWHTVFADIGDRSVLRASSIMQSPA